MPREWKLLKNESDPGHFLPYARHVNEHVVKLNNGELMAVMSLDGMAFETADVSTINDWHEKLNVALRSIADERVALMVHTVRRRDRHYPDGSFRSKFGAALDTAYRAKMMSRRLFRTEHFLTVMLRPAVGKADKAVSGLLGALRKGTAGAAEAEADFLDRMEELIRDTQKMLGRMNPVLLTTYEHGKGGLVFSQVLEMLQEVMTGKRQRVPLVRGHLGSALYSERVIFGKEVVEIRGAGGSSYAGILGVREHAARTFPGQLNDLLAAKFEFVLGQGFSFLGKHAGMETARRRHAQMGATDDVAVSQADELVDAMDDLQSNRFALGEHHLALTVFGETPKICSQPAVCRPISVPNSTRPPKPPVHHEVSGSSKLWPAHLAAQIDLRRRHAHAPAGGRDTGRFPPSDAASRETGKSPHQRTEGRPAAESRLVASPADAADRNGRQVALPRPGRAGSYGHALKPPSIL